MTNTDQTTTEPALDGDSLNEGTVMVAGDESVPAAEPETDTQPETDSMQAAESADSTAPEATMVSKDEGSGADAENDGAGEGGNDDDGEDEDDNPLEVEAEVAADYLEELLDIADLDGDIDTYVDGERAHVSIVSQSEALVGKDGKVLDALQELTRLAVLAETGQRSRLMLDVAGYRSKRRVELVALAGDAVQEVKDSSEPVHLTSMNPFERKIVHDTVAAAGLTSESEGEEPRRHVVILPARG